MNPDDFDADLEDLEGLREDIVGPPGPPGVQAIEEAAPTARRAGRTVKMLLERPEIAELFVAGVPNTEIAKQLGVSVSSVRNVRLRSPRMADLMAEESARVMAHLQTRQLGKESYSKLAFAVVQLSNQSELLNGRATSRTDINAQGTIESLTLAFYGVPRPQPLPNHQGPIECEAVDVSGEVDAGEEAGVLLLQSPEGEAD